MKEEKKIVSLMREDRENDLDDIDLGGFVFEEGMDYKAYLERQKVEAEQSDAAEGHAVESKIPKSKGSPNPKKFRKGRQDPKGQRTVRISFLTTPEISMALRVIAAKDAKTVSTFLNDLIKESLSEDISEVVQYLDLGNKNLP